MSKSIFPISIKIDETKNQTRNAQPVRLGIPFPCSELKNIDELQLNDETNTPIPFQAKVTASWHNHSIRWILIDFVTTISANDHFTYTLTKPESKKDIKPKNIITLKDSNSSITVNTCLATFKIDKNNFNPLSEISINGLQLELEPLLTELINSEGITHNPIIESIVLPAEHETLRTTIYFKGRFKNKSNNKSYLNFESSLQFFANTALCEFDFTLHNPNRAMHKGGFWDMGDPGSEYFKSLSICLNFKKNVSIKLKENIESSEWKEHNSGNIRLYQDSSGGENWNHKIHIDKDNQSTVSFKGYQLKVDDNIYNEGNRASPAFTIKDESQTQVTSTIKQFWQNFPKALSTNNNQLNIELFPNTPKADYELQGGEKKTHSIILDFGSSTNPLEQFITPLNITLPLEHYTKSKVMPWLAKEYKPTDLDKLIHKGLDGKRNFYWKREKADEYGWRNFGELWADHETLEHGNDDTLVSHYNNQYDPIYGFASQYLLTGDYRWFELMDDLAEHVIDIDIYHTNDDKPEYNNGLFWHTDHYLDGRHCTHRTFSKTHMEIDHVEQSGGGPGSQHCYTTGLMMHYFLTGYIRSKKTVLSLNKWAFYSNEGSQTVCEATINVLRKDLKTLKQVINGCYLFKYKFPLTRGTGNYIQTLLDTYNLTGKQQYFDKAFQVISNTLGPKDNIEKRNLISQIESNWHYTVLLQAVIRFISLKQQNSNYDDQYHYVLSIFLHYAKWMYENEKPYLKSEEQLVYPNPTWVSQDFRKISILSSYEKLSGLESKKSVTISNEVVPYLLSSNQKTYTRILILLMQNYNFIPLTKVMEIKDIKPKVINEKQTVPSILYQSIAQLFKAITRINIKNELNWIKLKVKR